MYAGKFLMRSSSSSGGCGARFLGKKDSVYFLVYAFRTRPHFRPFLIARSDKKLVSRGRKWPESSWRAHTVTPYSLETLLKTHTPLFKVAKIPKAYQPISAITPRLRLPFVKNLWDIPRHYLIIT